MTPSATFAHPNNQGTSAARTHPKRRAGWLILLTVGAVALWTSSAFGQSDYQPEFVVESPSGEWWQQVSVDPQAASLEMQEVDGDRWPLELRPWGEFTSGVHVSQGTPVQLIATRDDGAEAASSIFSYLLEQPGSTCEADCTGRVCGSDGCGGSCGTCAAGWDCDNGVCVEEPAYVPYDPELEVSSSSNEWWQQVAANAGAETILFETEPGDAWWLNREPWGEFTSGVHVVTGTPVRLTATAADGRVGRSTWFAYLLEQPTMESETCTPDCVSVECGADGCGGSCGTCEPGWSCDVGTCVEDEPVCTPDCAGVECGADGCGGSCGTCATGWDCDSGQCVEEPPVDPPPVDPPPVDPPPVDPPPVDSYDPDFEVLSSSNEWWQQVEALGGAESIRFEVQGGASWSLSLQPWGHFTSGVHVVTGTSVRLVATDESGRVGQSSWFAYLEEQPTTDAGTCTPDCAGVECGADGCGGMCGSCAPGWSCETGLCVELPVCEPDCYGRDCGTDGCGGSCGTCSTGFSCESGICVDEDTAPSYDPDLEVTSSSNEWWQQVVANNGAASVLFEVDGGTSWALTREPWGHFTSGVHVVRGTSVRLTATDAVGRVGRSEWFPWLQAQPVHDGGTGDNTLRAVVDVSTPPNGLAEPVRIDSRFYSVNIADWDDDDYTPTPSPAFRTYLAALHPGTLRWPAGHSSQHSVWMRTGTHPSERTLSPAKVEAFMNLCDAVGAEPLFGINVKTGTIEEAADLVRYLNLERGHGVRYFYVGNEPDHLDGLTSGPAEHSARHLAFASANRAVDPGALLIGPEIMTGGDVLPKPGEPDWMTPIVEEIGLTLDGVSWHVYPLASEQQNPDASAYASIEHLLQEEGPDWPPAGMGFADDVMPHLHALMAAYAPGAEGVWLTEIGEDSGPESGIGLADTSAAMLWMAGILGRYAGWGVVATHRWIFTGDGGAGHALLDEGYNPRASYSTYWLYANHFGQRMVHAESNQRHVVNVHAAVRDDGVLTVVLVNKTETPQVVEVELQGTSVAEVASYTLRGQSLTDTAPTLNGAHMSLSVAENGVPPVAVAPASLSALEVPPVSVVLLEIR